MLESAAYAFGWINPLLRQMAPSPCRADKPQSARHPLLHFCVCVCVYMFHQKKSTGKLAVVKMVNGSVLVLEYDGKSASLPPPPHTHTKKCLDIFLKNVN